MKRGWKGTLLKDSKSSKYNMHKVIIYEMMEITVLLVTANKFKNLVNAG